MKKNTENKIVSIEPGSPAERYGVRVSEVLLRINDQEIEDVFDYRYLIQNEKLVLTLRDESGQERRVAMKKDAYDDLGLQFENDFMSEYHSCTNKCIFCFIDQMPPNMRETLYFKDDDSRLSFLQGNYITLTNMSDHDAERIIRYHLAPINVSVHTMNPELRCKMLNNRFAGKALARIRQFYEAGIEMNAQVVLCPGVNDGDELRRTIEELSQYVPVMPSMSVVPVGMTKYREGLYPMKPVTKELACETIDLIEEFQKKIYKRTGYHFVHASDEFYILAGRPMPEEERYDGYLQLENGVGMIRSQIIEVREAMRATLKEYGRTHWLGRKTVMLEGKRQVIFLRPSYTISIATGKLAYPYIKKYAQWFMRYFPNVTIQVFCIRNDFFGELITVTGLITAQDLIAQLKGRDLGEKLFLPACMFRSGEEVFLDDLTKQDVETALQVPVHIVKSSGQDMIDIFMNISDEKKIRKGLLHNPYELTES